MSQLFTAQAELRAEELGVADQVQFIHGDAAGYVSDDKVGVADCLGATWIAGGVVGTIVTELGTISFIAGLDVVPILFIHNRLLQLQHFSL